MVPELDDELRRRLGRRFGADVEPWFDRLPGVLRSGGGMADRVGAIDPPWHRLGAVRKLRADLETRLSAGTDAEAVDWLVETYQISIVNAQPIVEFFRAQLAISEMPVGRANC